MADCKRQWNVVSKCCLSFFELIGRVILIEERVKLGPNRNCRRLVIPLAPLFLKFVELLHYSLLVPSFTLLLVATFLLNPLDYSCKNHIFKDLLSYILAFSWHVNYLNVLKLKWFWLQLNLWVFCINWHLLLYDDEFFWLLNKCFHNILIVLNLLLLRGVSVLKLLHNS